MPWVPLNRHMADVGVVDSREEALTYLRRLTHGREPDPLLLEAYVDTAADVIEYLEAKTPLRMSAPPTFSDYFADLPGGKPAGRSIEPVPFDARTELGDWAARLRTSPHLPWLTMEEGGRFLTGVDAPDLELAGRRERDRRARPRAGARRLAVQGPVGPRGRGRDGHGGAGARPRRRRRGGAAHRAGRDRAAHRRPPRRRARLRRLRVEQGDGARRSSATTSSR